MLLSTPREFSFQHSLDFLRRSPKELLHHVTEAGVEKALHCPGEAVVIRIAATEETSLRVTFLSAEPGEAIKQHVAAYVREWFDLDTDLAPFYELAAGDKLLKELAQRYYGYRIVGQPDLFESLVWAVLGQQINLSFAYTLKQRFVQSFGERLALGDREYFLFPSPQTVSLLRPEDLLPLQFSTQKSRYTIAIAEAFASGELSKDRVSGLPFEDAKQELMKIKGIGNWTANYALMKTFRYRNAFPLEDAGLHNAIRILKKMDRKPTLAEVTRIFRKYKGWEAYATLYLWKSL